MIDEQTKENYVDRIRNVIDFDHLTSCIKQLQLDTIREVISAAYQDGHSAGSMSNQTQRDMHKIAISFDSNREQADNMLEVCGIAETEFGAKITHFTTCGLDHMLEIHIGFPTREIAQQWLEEIYFWEDPGYYKEVEELLSYGDPA